MHASEGKSRARIDGDEDECRDGDEEDAAAAVDAEGAATRVASTVAAKPTSATLMHQRSCPSAKKRNHVCKSLGLAGARETWTKEALIVAMARSDYMQMRMGKENEAEYVSEGLKSMTEEERERG